ncbi:peroxisomal leader peptide-processing protease [Denticeps clupeoides]|uniref:Peroxisomal leader peptide-processing protease n=1 Tax=Denticeps clupeoides TaxID=299321 RepID=A0AAY4CKV8_9TELE|nr:peroxisomal leader peptide-processing protease [Denticeps clupeoides]
MTSPEEACCIVSVSDPLDPGAKPTSCSGTVLNPHAGVVLCSGALFSRFAEDAHAARVRVQWPTASAEMNACGSGSGSRSPARLLMLVSCPQFRSALRRLFRDANKWSFCAGEEKAEALADSNFSCCFAVLAVPGLGNRAGAVSWLSSASLRKGSEVVACGSPFASFCPDIFMNTLSKGVVSNLAGEENAVILTDARCLPGTEGGGLFLQEGPNSHLVGIIVSPLCWKSGEWIGLTLVCSLQSILENMRHSATSISALRDISGNEVSLGEHRLASKLPSVVLVESGQFWGSGVLLGPHLMVTCRHVINGRSGVTVRMNLCGRFHSVLGDVLYSSKESSPYDVAVVKLKEDLKGVASPQFASSFDPGEDVLVVGYGAFGDSCGPSMTSGILSKTITHGSVPVMLQTTCAVLSGASGGAVVKTNTGELLGIVASNTRDFTAKVTFPHLNFSIPVTVLKPLLRQFSQTGDTTVFEQLDTVDKVVRRVWRLQAATSKL